MRTIIQRVKMASVNIDGSEISSIGNGILLLLGIETTDNQDDIDWITKKITQLRIFNDENGIMNRSVMDVGGEIMVVSQFTLFASTKKGNRPSYIRAAHGDIAIPMYKAVCETIAAITGNYPATGVFGADMQIELINDGPVTIILDSKNKDI